MTSINVVIPLIGVHDVNPSVAIVKVVIIGFRQKRDDAFNERKRRD